MAGKRDELEQFAKQGKGIREVLQTVEDALMDARYDDFVVACEHGTFRWRTVERARADRANDVETEF